MLENLNLQKRKRNCFQFRLRLAFFLEFLHRQNRLKVF
ncbi:hypothetical protein LEP1GSC145_4074 [Leptospira interrogans serovar Djasiman str. LT1649]|nr:hypothetical protein LEP1GSC148_0648 [Leptospira interrogans serovar Canicola str. LT1962]EMM88775.1 hypothetical protein LEP1GSC145_4074 [Leptospira interrogans serovar Djasiman str. LT1649]EMN69443.1 hypothetical protein LEP1GSC100_0061 [Leptospira interrogans serovar Bataviae str. UI 08561]